MKAFLILEDGTVFKGTSIGSTREVISEIVFNTSMTGYLEVLTDPSYAGQAVTMTYPLIGNYGSCYQDMESARSQKPGNQSGMFLHLHEWHAGYHEAFLLKYLKERHGAVLEFFLYFQAIKNHHRSQSQERSNVLPCGIDQRSRGTSLVCSCCIYYEAEYVRKYWMHSDTGFSGFFP